MLGARGALSPGATVPPFLEFASQAEPGVEIPAGQPHANGDDQKAGQRQHEASPSRRGARAMVMTGATLASQGGEDDEGGDRHGDDQEASCPVRSMDNLAKHLHPPVRHWNDVAGGAVASCGSHRPLRQSGARGASLRWRCSRAFRCRQKRRCRHFLSLCPR